MSWARQRAEARRLKHGEGLGGDTAAEAASVRDELLEAGVVRVGPPITYLRPRARVVRLDAAGRREAIRQVREHASHRQLAWLAQHGPEWMRPALCRVVPPRGGSR